MSPNLKTWRLGALVTAVAVVLTACGTGTESGSDAIERNTAISAQTMAELLPVGVRIEPNERAAVVVGGTQTEMCTIDHAGSLWCWGREPSVLIRDQAVSVSPVPMLVKMPSNRRVTALSTGTGDVTCAVAGGEVFCWGLNASRMVSVSAQGESYFNTPTRIAGLSGPAVDVAVAFSSACAVIIDGVVECWGDGRSGTMTQQAALDVFPRVPVVLPYISNAVKIVGGYQGFCVIDVQSSLKCWGNNSNGRLGAGPVEPTYTARTPLGKDPVISVSMSLTHTCAVLATGAVKCFGENRRGQLGLESNVLTPFGEPQVIRNLYFDAVSVSVGREQSCANDISGQVWCWGLTLGYFSVNSTPTKVPNLSDVMSLASTTGDAPTICATRWDGQLRCAGFDSSGALGDGLPERSNSTSGVSITGFGIQSLVGSPRTTSGSASGSASGSVSVQTVAPTTTTSNNTMPPAATTDSTSVSSTVDASSVTVPAATSPSTVRRMLSVKVGKKVTSSAMVRFAGISAPKSSKVKVSVAKAGTRFCKASGTSVQGKKVGVCSVKVSVTPKGQKARIRTIFVNVVR